MPLRIEIGPRDIENEQVVFARRDMPGKEGKTFIPIANVAETATQMLLDTIQADMLKRATEFRDANTFEPTNYDSFKEVIENGFARAWWCGNAECENQVKAETQATIRCIPMEQPQWRWRVYCLRHASKRGRYLFRAHTNIICLNTRLPS